MHEQPLGGLGGIGLSAGLGGVDVGAGSKNVVPIFSPQGKDQDIKP